MKGRIYNLVKHSQTLVQLNQGVAQPQAVLPLSWEVEQVLIPRQAMLAPSQEGVQALQALILSQAVLNPPSWEEVQTVQSLIPRQAGVSAPAKAPLVLHWGCHFFPRQYSRYHQGTRAKTWKAGIPDPFPARTPP